jgi:hypothetical protein
MVDSDARLGQGIDLGYHGDIRVRVLGLNLLDDQDRVAIGEERSNSHREGGGQG